jgi:hypothetical protein
MQVVTGPPCPGIEGRNVAGMDTRDDVRQFLVLRRARITPERAGLPLSAELAVCRGCAAPRWPSGGPSSTSKTSVSRGRPHRNEGP